MPDSHNPTPEMPRPQGISLDELANAFAQVMGTEPRRAAEPTEPSDHDAPQDDQAEAQAAASAPPEVDISPREPENHDDSCPISPRSILEAMLFVGNRDNMPLSPRRVAELMRDVSPDEIPPLVDELNRRYTAEGAAYHIIGEGDGYRLTLREELHSLRNRFYGHVREARLSQAAIDVLALVAYQQPLTGETIHHLRGKPSNHVLSQLVRRGLLRIERPLPKRRTPHYYTTDRFLRLFNLESLDDLPRSEEPEPS